MKNYSKNETVVARLSGESGVVIDDENDAQLGWLYQVRFPDGSIPWLKECEIRKVQGMSAVELIAAERSRQINQEGWSLSNDDRLKGNELAKAAACYAMPDEFRNAIIWNITLRFRMWPWAARFWKPSPDNRIRELVKAGALIVAEIERLQRSHGRES